ncbi:MAG: dipeptidase [Sandaracinaceae bacterium]|nr:dipeptidase [Sandaracinaceae bacterium]
MRPSGGRAWLAMALWTVGFTACGEPPAGAPPPAAPIAAGEAPVERSPAEPAPSAVPAGSPAAPVEPVLLAIDTHVDTTQRMLDEGDDLAQELPNGHLDLPRMRRGGLHGAFFSIWVDPREHEGEAAWARALALIGAVEALAARHPAEVAIARTGDEVRAAQASGRVALLMGIEGAHAFGAPARDEVLFERLREAHARGVRYLTITWSNDNRFGHSSSGRAPSRGLTPLGRRLIRELHALGVIVDVSHVSDRTFWDIAAIAERPLLASHSSCRALSAHPRNVTDPMIRAIAEGGGAVCINFYTRFIDAEYAARRTALESSHRARFAQLRREHERWDRSEPQNALARALGGEALGVPTLETLGAHFAHAAAIGGPGAVCLGSDFDGVGELPLGLEDVARLGALRAELERRGLPLGPILGENVLRVLDAQRE